MGGQKRIIILREAGRYSHQKNFDSVPDICKLLLEQMNILSIGRFSEAKNYDNVPDICRRIGAWD